MVAIVRRNPNRALMVMEPISQYSILDEAEMLLSDFWPVAYYHTHTGEFLPVDLYEKKDELVMKIEVPGIKREDIDISLEGDLLTIKAEKQQEESVEDTDYFTCERSFGSYSRSVSLPFPVDANKISTTFENGILEIRLPKTEQAKARRIQIKAGSPKSLPTKSK